MASGERRRRSRLRRRGPTREPYDRVLIVCEDAKVEPAYFRALIDHYRLSTANVRVIGSGSDPSHLVKRAKQLRSEGRQSGDRYDAVYCVFDRDEHAHFAAASHDARAAKLMLARSWPCFEFWLLLHFTYHRRAYARSGSRTAAEMCKRELRRHLPDDAYDLRRMFEALEDRLSTAKLNAARARNDAESIGRDNPSTEVHSLVAYLQSLKPGGTA